MKTKTDESSSENHVEVRSNLFKKATNEQAYLKAGILGFPGSGKTYTGYLIAKGIIKTLGKKGTPLLFVDTETGSDFLVKLAESEGIPLYVSKTRAFEDLLVAVDEAERLGAVLIIDSITHFWTELQDAYKKEKKRSRLYFQDWGPLKDTWRKFTDRFVNSKVHIVMNGRAGYEYDYSIDETGAKQLEKTGTKMKAETDMGYEPSLLIEMVREPQIPETIAGSSAGKKKVEGRLWNHVAYVLKDRTRTLEGQRFENPTFEEFKPAVMYLNIGGNHVGVDTSKDSTALFKNEPEKEVSRRITDVQVTLEEIQGLIVSAIPGMSAGDKREKAELINFCFGTRSWTKVEHMRLEELKNGLAALNNELKKRGENRIIAGQEK